MMGAVPVPSQEGGASDGQRNTLSRVMVIVELMTVPRASLSLLNDQF